MGRVQFAVGYATLALAAAILVGLVYRGYYRLCWSFAAYLAVYLASSVLMLLVPDMFYTRQFWLYKESTLNALKFGIALELAWKTFRAFPGALATVRATVFVVLAATLGAVLTVPAPREFDSIAGETQARIVNGTVWLFTGIAAVILWYRLPVNPFHKTLLIGFVPYLFAFTVVLQLFRTYGFDELAMVNNYLYPIAYLVVLSYWCFGAWRRH
jgi:hypothetical protein